MYVLICLDLSNVKNVRFGDMFRVALLNLLECLAKISHFRCNRLSVLLCRPKYRFIYRTN